MSAKRLDSFWNKRLSALAVLVLIAVLPTGADAVPCGADCIATDGNSSITVGPDESPDPGALTSWIIDGTNHIYEQGFWLRYTVPGAGQGPEAHQSTLNVDSADASGSDITIEYSDNVVSVEAYYSLTGGAAGSGTASLFERFTISINAPLIDDLSFFVYTDADVNDTSGDETAVFDGVDTITQTDEDGVTTLAVTSVSLFSHWQIDEYSNILDSLQDGAATILSDSVSPFGPEDATQAFQFDFINLELGEELVIDIRKRVAFTTSVPEPATLLLLGLGFVPLGFRRLKGRQYFARNLARQSTGNRSHCVGVRGHYT